MCATLKWGFFGAGKITRDFVTALKLLPKSKHVAVAIASRSIDKATNFALENDLKKSYGNYEDLAQDPDIDIIYIGTVNSQHFHNAKLAIKHGKHVLCEKPLCVNYKQGKALTDYARENKVFLMEGFWTTFFPGFKKLEEEIEKKTIGKILELVLIIGNKFGEQDRFKIKELGGGCTINHGVYGLFFANKFFGPPDKVIAGGHLSESGIDVQSTITLLYEKTASCALVQVDSRATQPGELVLVGTDGILKLPYPFWAPHRLETPNGNIDFELPEAGESTFNYIRGSGFIYEAEEVRQCIQKGLLESPSISWDDSLAVLKVADEVRRILGVHFPQDDDINK